MITYCCITQAYAQSVVARVTAPCRREAALRAKAKGATVTKLSQSRVVKEPNSFTGEFGVGCKVQTNNWLGRTGGAGLILEATRNDFRASSTSQVNLKNSMFSLCGRRPLHKIGCPKPRFPEASHGQVSSHVDHHRSLKSSIPELSEKYWVDRCAVSPKRAISYALEVYILLQIHP